jgi:hypothetical protein
MDYGNLDDEVYVAQRRGGPESQVRAWVLDRFKPKFHRVRMSILLICEGITQNSLCGYWEHSDQFVGPGLRRGRLRHLLEG